MMSKAEVLDNFIKANQHLAKQGSAEWLEQKQYTIGGSQIATVLGINKYETPESLVKSKAGMLPFKKAAPLWFGNLMERCVEQYVDLAWGAKVVETGSLTHTNPCISYSPDGLCVIEKKKIKCIFSKLDFSLIQSTSMFDPSDDILALMEFKSPYMRRPVHGKIPEYYIPQPQLGMCVIPIAEVSIFVECVFRFCSREDLYTNKYSWYHFDRPRYNSKQIAYGAISVEYDPMTASDITKSLVDELKDNTSGFNTNNDLGLIEDKKLFNRLLEALIDGELTPIYHDMLGNIQNFYDSDVWMFHKYNNPNRFDQTIYDRCIESGNNYVGFLTYKLMDVNVNPVFKKDILTNQVTRKVESIIDLVKQIVSEPDIKNKEMLTKSARDIISSD